MVHESNMYLGTEGKPRHPRGCAPAGVKNSKLLATRRVQISGQSLLHRDRWLIVYHNL